MPADLMREPRGIHGRNVARLAPRWIPFGHVRDDQCRLPQLADRRRDDVTAPLTLGIRVVRAASLARVRSEIALGRASVRLFGRDACGKSNGQDPTRIPRITRTRSELREFLPARNRQMRRVFCERPREVLSSRAERGVTGGRPGPGPFPKEQDRTGRDASR